MSVGTYTLLQSLLFPVLPTLQEALHTSQAAATWVFTAYLLSGAVCTPILGRLGDRYGKKRLYLVSLGALAVGSLLGALAASLALMVVARVIQGVGGGVLPLAFGIVQEEMPAREVAGTIGLVSAVAGVGSGLGIVLAGPIVAVLGYHGLFWIPLVPSTVAVIAALLVLPASRTGATGRLRWPAFVLLATWLVALLLVVSTGGQWGWTSPLTLGLAATAAVTFVAWVRVESRSETPLIDMQLMRLRGVWTNNLVALLVGTSMFAGLAFAAALVQTCSSAGYGFGSSVTQSGLIIAAQPLMVIIVGTVIGRLTRRVGSRMILISGAAAMAGATALVGLVHAHIWEVALWMALTGVGTGLVVAAQANLSVTVVPPEQTGVSAGMNANIRLIGGAIGAAVIATIVAAGGTAGDVPAEAGYRYGFVTLAAFTALGAIVAILVPTSRQVAVPTVVAAGPAGLGASVERPERGRGGEASGKATHGASHHGYNREDD